MSEWHEQKFKSSEELSATQRKSHIIFFWEPLSIMLQLYNCLDIPNTLSIYQLRLFSWDAVNFSCHNGSEYIAEEWVLIIIKRKSYLVCLKQCWQGKQVWYLLSEDNILYAPKPLFRQGRPFSYSKMHIIKHQSFLF